MYYALNNKGKRICSVEADKNEDYFCPICNENVILRRGDHNAPHFAHIKESDCLDTWNDDSHRADILVNNTVIEFQHSNISSEEFEERNAFYISCGFHVVWLFDIADRFESDRITMSDTHSNEYRWKWGSSLFNNSICQS